MVQTYCAICKMDIHAMGLETGLQEILAYRIHLHRDHGVYKNTEEALMHRETLESATPKGMIPIDVDREERWLDSVISRRDRTGLATVIDGGFRCRKGCGLSFATSRGRSAHEKRYCRGQPTTSP